MNELRKSVRAPVLLDNCDGKDPLVCYNFLQKFILASKANAWQNEILVAQFACHLTESASKWFHSLEKRCKDSHTQLTWELFRASFLEQLCSFEVLKIKSLTELFQIQKEINETYFSYYLRASNLRMITDTIDESFIMCLMRGLSLEDRLRLAVRTYNVEELVDTFHRLDFVLKDTACSVTNSIDNSSTKNVEECHIAIQPGVSPPTQSKHKCRKRKRCMHCNSYGHLVKTCTRKKNGLPSYRKL